MKNRIAIGAVVAALFFVCIALNAKVVKYTDFIGVWYHKSDGIQYIFEDGIIKCADNEIILLNNDVFSGAYTFAKNKAAIFVIDDNGVGEIVELHLVRKAEGDRLCERKDGNEIIWFCRNIETTIDDTIIDK